ncbi:hypothetical protein [Streptomyces caeruleatus]|uniref:Uncharacterized protein n=1 Tax=Streptomyces caeruleatus TaxID=661399 RepID=A0A101TLH2_9ACTN|nr:hypothetical protein [Streptomyces caeruleatus]KUN94508.1 hypothetical protein AQJ67_36875 [Streptomyces caeruleatus]
MLSLKSKTAMLLIGSALIGGLTPGVASAASYPSVMLQVCNNYQDSAEAFVRITGINQNGVRVEAPGLYIPRNQCRTWQNVTFDYKTSDYWWKTDQIITVFNNRVIKDSGTSGHTDPRNSTFRIPRSAPNGGVQRATLNP